MHKIIQVNWEGWKCTYTMNAQIYDSEKLYANRMQAFYMNENQLLMKHFNSVSYETIQENLVKEDSYWHYSFEADGKTYVILLGMMEDASASVAAQVSGGWTNCTVSVVAGTDSEPAIADGVLSINVSGVEAILCQSTPNA